MKIERVSLRRICRVILISAACLAFGVAQANSPVGIKHDPDCRASHVSIPKGANPIMEYLGLMDVDSHAAVCLQWILYPKGFDQDDVETIIRIMQRDSSSRIRVNATGVLLGETKIDTTRAVRLLVDHLGSEDDENIFARIAWIGDLIRRSPQWNDRATLSSLVSTIKAFRLPRQTLFESEDSKRSVRLIAEKSGLFGAILHLDIVRSHLHDSNSSIDDATLDNVISVVADLLRVNVARDMYSSGQLIVDVAAFIEAKPELPARMSAKIEPILFECARKEKEWSIGHCTEAVEIFADAFSKGQSNSDKKDGNTDWSDLGTLLIGDLLKMRVDASPRMRRSALKSLRFFVWNNAQVVDGLIESLSDTDARARNAAITALDSIATKLPKMPERANEALRKIVLSDSDFTLSGAIRLLSSDPSDATVSAIAGVMTAQDRYLETSSDAEESREISDAAAKFLIKRGRQSVIHVLANVSKVGWGYTRDHLFEVLERLNWLDVMNDQTAEMGKVLEQAYLQPERDVRDLALSLLARLGPHMKEPFEDQLASQVALNYFSVPDRAAVVHEYGLSAQLPPSAWKIDPNVAGATVIASSVSTSAANQVVRWMCVGWPSGHLTAEDEELDRVSAQLQRMGSPALLPVLNGILDGPNEHCAAQLYGLMSHFKLDKVAPDLMARMLRGLRSPNRAQRRSLLLAMANAQQLPVSARARLQHIAATGGKVEASLARRALRKVAGRSQA